MICYPSSIINCDYTEDCPSNLITMNIKCMHYFRQVVCIISGKLYAVGGRDGTSCLATGECYDPEQNTWSAVAPMTMKRGGVAVAVIGDLLYAVGG